MPSFFQKKVKFLPGVNSQRRSKKFLSLFKYFFLLFPPMSLKCKTLKPVIGFYIFCFLDFQMAQGSSFQYLGWAQKEYQNGFYEKAHDYLDGVEEKDIELDKKYLLAFLKGLVFYSEKKYSKALFNFKKSLQHKPLLSGAIQYYMGLVHMESSNKGLAQKGFLKVIQGDSSSYIKNQARYQMAQISLKEKKYRKAQRGLRRLEKKMRGSKFYPHILWLLVQVYGNQRKHKSMCHWARRLYIQYPTYKEVKDWSLDWKKNEFKDEKINCHSSLAEQGRRIRKLQFLGEDKKASQDLRQFKKIHPDSLDKDMVVGGLSHSRGTG